MNSEVLIEEICNEGIEIIDFDFKGKAKGLYFDNTIAIDSNIKSDAERKCVLAEELGHHYKSHGNILDTRDIRKVKQEKMARKWSYERLVGIVDIINAHNAGTKNRYEMAEYLHVTEEFLEEVIKHYREKYGVSYTIDNYTIYFEPTLGVLKMF